MADLLTTPSEARTYARLERLQAAEARAFGEQVDRLADLVEEVRSAFKTVDVDKHLGLSLAGHLRLGQGRALALAHDATRLREELPRTLAGLRAGTIWVPQARVLLRETQRCSQPVATETERRVLAEGGGELCPADLTKLVKQHLLQVEADLEPGATAERERDATEGRKVSARPVEDGQALLFAVGPAEKMALFGKALDVLCAQAKAFDDANGVVRTAAQRRFDVLMDLPNEVLAWQRALAEAVKASGWRPGATRAAGADGTEHTSAGAEAAAADGPTGPSGADPFDPGFANPFVDVFGPDGPFAGSVFGPGGPFRPASASAAPTVNLHLPMASALGLSNAPGHLEGYGPVCAAHVRRLLPDSRLRRVVVDAETGLPLAADDRTTEPPGSHQAARACIREWVLDEEPTVVDDTPEPRYKASRKLKALVGLRDMRCSGPGCGQPAHVCEFEHRQPYDHANPAAGGQTSAANGHPASVRCHNAKTHGGWTLTRHDDGSTTWTSPLGRGFRRPAFWRPPPAIRDGARLLPPDDLRWLGRVSPRGPTGLTDSSATTDDSTDADTWMVDALTEEDAAATAHGAAQDAVTHPDGATSPVRDATSAERTGDTASLWWPRDPVEVMHVEPPF